MPPPLCLARNFLQNSSQIRAVRCFSLQRLVNPPPPLCVSVCPSGHLKPPSHPQHTSVRQNTQHRVILLPEYPGQTAQTNPTLKSYKDGLPKFGDMTEANCYYGLGQRLMEFESAVCRMEASIEAGEKDWEVLLKQMEGERVELENIWATVSLLNIATDKLDMDRFMQLEKRAERALLTRYDSRTIHGFVTGDWVGTVGGEDRRVLDRFVTEYKNQGYELPEKKYLELNANWMKRLAEAQRDQRFKVTTATQRLYIAQYTSSPTNTTFTQVPSRNP